MVLRCNIQTALPAGQVLPPAPTDPPWRYRAVYNV